MKEMNKRTKRVAVFYGGKISRHLGMVRAAAEKLGVKLDLISYNQVGFETGEGKVRIKKKGEFRDPNDYEVLFFRTTGKHWEEVSLVLDEVKERVERGEVKVVDPLVLKGRPSDACKAHQMLALRKAGIGVPKTVYGSLWNLYGMMAGSPHVFADARTNAFRVMAAHPKNMMTSPSMMTFNFPVILKGSGGDRGTRVFKAEDLEGLEKLVRGLRRSEIEEGRRYMLQEYIENEGDYRVLVLGKKVLGVMKRRRQSKGEFRNNYSAGGRVERADLPEEIKDLAVKAAEVTGLWVAGVDIMPLKGGRNKSGEISREARDYVVLEVNKGPQFRGFMEATGIDVPRKIVEFLVSLV